MATATDERTESAEDKDAMDAFNKTPDTDDKSLEEEADLEEEDDGQMAIAGTKSNLTATAGGRRPDVSRAKVRAITLPVTGQFDKGEILRITYDVKVKDVSFKDEEDEHGRVIRTWREHVFTPQAVVDVGPVPEG